MHTDHVIGAPTSSLIVSTIPIFFPILLIFFMWECRTCYIWQFSIYSSHVFWCHYFLVHSGDCSGTSTAISIFHGQSEILAGQFHWNGTRIHRNDWNPAGISGASVRACSSALFHSGRPQCAWIFWIVLQVVLLIPVLSEVAKAVKIISLVNIMVSQYI